MKLLRCLGTTDPRKALAELKKKEGQLYRSGILELFAGSIDSISSKIGSDAQLTNALIEDADWCKKEIARGVGMEWDPSFEDDVSFVSMVIAAGCVISNQSPLRPCIQWIVDIITGRRDIADLFGVPANVDARWLHIFGN